MASTISFSSSLGYVSFNDITYDAPQQMHSR